MCKGDNTLDRRPEGDRFLLVCESCGAAFDNVLFSGMKMIRGDSRYLGLTLPCSVWSLIRFLPAGDSLLASYSDGSVTYYATQLGLIRWSKAFSSMKYSDLYGIELVRAWMPSVYSTLGALLFLCISVMSALMAVASSIYVGFISSALFFCLCVILIALSRKKAYQFYSPILSKKEHAAWRIRKLKSKDADEFISLVKERL